MAASLSITCVTVKDIRFPTSESKDGSDAVHTDPDYSCAYVILETEVDRFKGYGFTFTIGRGTDVVVCAINALKHILLGADINNIFKDFVSFHRKLTNDSQLRWIGPEKGVIHLATAAIVNALWDLWAKMEDKPVWKLLSDMPPEQLISCLDFTYVTDALTKEEALSLLNKHVNTRKERELELTKQGGYPAYTTHCGWLGYDDEKVVRLCKEALSQGFTMFKAKVGQNLADDKRRLSLIRKAIGDNCDLMVDANQRWSVPDAIDYMKQLTEYNLKWIEEPTSPDDILGHLEISQALAPHGIGVATGEQCQNKVMFKQFITSGALQYCQIDSCRLASVNEIVLVILMAAKYKVPVCPHAGGVGLCELVQHLAIFDFICVSATLEDRVTEYVDHLHEHFVHPTVVENARYQLPQAPGYSSQMKAESIITHEYPNGNVWKAKLKKTE